jgi:hypothetical protein
MYINFVGLITHRSISHNDGTKEVDGNKIVLEWENGNLMVTWIHKNKENWKKNWGTLFKWLSCSKNYYKYWLILKT